MKRISEKDLPEVDTSFETIDQFLAQPVFIVVGDDDELFDLLPDLLYHGVLN